MDEPRAPQNDPIAVALAGLDRRIEDTADRVLAIIAANDRRYTEIRQADQKAVTLEVTRIQELDHLMRSYQDKFEESIKERFAQVNEFRGSLDDLGKTMATRRELESINTTGLSKVDEQGKSLSLRIDQNQLQINDLRSRLDVGPAQLGSIQTRLDQSSGISAGKEAAQVMLARSIAMAGGLLGIAAIIVGLLFR